MAAETLSQLQPRLPELVDRACQSHDRFFITRNGHTDDVLLAAEEYEGLMETLEILSDPEAVQRLHEAKEAFERGEGRSLETILRELRGGSGPS